MSGGGSQPTQPAQQTITNNPIADWAQPTATALIGSQMNNAFNIDANGNVTGSRGFTPFGGQTNSQGQFTGSPVSQDQYNQQLQVAGLGVAGPSALQQKSYQGAANLQTPGQFMPASQMAGYGTASALSAGQNFQNMATNPGSVQAYMNPYLQASLDPQLAEIQRQYGITGAQQAGQATQQGAFGGSRDAIMAAENQRNKNTAMNQVIGQGYNTAFNNAQNQMNTGAQLGLQGAQAGIQGAGQLANIGTQQLAAQQGVLGTQNQMGSQEQQNQQNVINQAMQNYGNQQNYGTTQAGNIMNLLRTTPTSQTQTVYQAPPSLTSQAAGLGTAGIAGYKLATMAGGGIAKVKKFDVGGEVERDLYEMGDANPNALAKEVKITSSPTIKKQGTEILRQKAMGFAPGGIVAFADGGEADDDVEPVQMPSDDEDYDTRREMEMLRNRNVARPSRPMGNSMLGNPMGEMMMPEMIMSAAKPKAPPVVNKTSQPNNGVQDIIDAKAKKYNLPPQLLHSIAKAESGLNPNAANKASSAKGLYQFVDSTWKGMGGEEGKQFDPELNADMGAKYIKQNAEYLKRRLGRDPTYSEVYGAHFFGPTGAYSLLSKAKPTMPIEKAFGLYNSEKGVNKIMRQNPNLKGKTVGQVFGELEKKTGEGIVKFAGGGEVKHFVAGDYVMDDYGNRVVDKSGKTMRNNLSSVTDDFGNKVEPKTSSSEKPTNSNNPNRKTVKQLVEAERNKTKLSTSVPNVNTSNGIVNLGKSSLKSLFSLPGQAILAGGSAASNAAANTMADPMMESNRRGLQDNFMLGALGGDTSFASAIMDAAEQNPNKKIESKPTESKYKADPNSDQVSRRNINTNYGENVKPSEQQMGPPIELMGRETNTEAVPNKPDFRDLMQQHLMDSWNKQGKQAEEDKYMALLSAGLGMMGGTSPYAAANIGQGAQQGIAAHLAARKAQQAQQNSLLSGYGILSKDRYYDAIADKSGIAAEALEHKKANDIIANAKTGMKSAMDGLRLANTEKALLKDDSGYKNAVSFVNAYGNKKDLNPSQQSQLDNAKNIIRSKELPIQNKINEFNKIYNYHATNLGVPGIGGDNEGGSKTIKFDSLN